MGRRILIVYNANAGLVAGALDTLHKIASPATYPCRLCELSYGLVGMKRAWRETLAGVDAPVVFFHKDDVPYPDVRLPAILLEEGGEITEMVSSDDFASIASLSDLQSAFREALRRHGVG
jgi:hypothetical protein